MSKHNLTDLQAAILPSFLQCGSASSAMGDTGSTYTDAKELAKETGLPFATVRGVVGTLVKAGLVWADDEADGGLLCLSEEGCQALIDLGY